MATMYPQLPRYCGFRSDAERLVYSVLAHQLPDECIVLFGVRLLVRDGPDEIDAEADFIIVEPECGVLVLEIKGGAGSGGTHARGNGFPWIGVGNSMRSGTRSSKRGGLAMHWHGN